MSKDKKPSGLKAEILDLFDDYLDSTGAILDDYLASEDMISELAACDKDFRENIEDLEAEEDFTDLLAKKQT